jgi:hypothetical protein
LTGQIYFDRDRDMSRRAELEARKKALLERAREREKKQAPAAGGRHEDADPFPVVRPGGWPPPATVSCCAAPSFIP